jgi:hypothetical protein
MFQFYHWLLSIYGFQQRASENFKMHIHLNKKQQEFLGLGYSNYDRSMFYLFYLRFFMH